MRSTRERNGYDDKMKGPNLEIGSMAHSLLDVDPQLKASVTIPDDCWEKKEKITKKKVGCFSNMLNEREEIDMLMGRTC